MLTTCPNCGAANQEVGKYCENCGRMLDPNSLPLSQGQTQPPTAGGAQPAGVGQTPGVGAPGAAGVVGAQFAVVRDGRADPSDGFTITRRGEFLVGRPDTETGVQVDVDVRQWVQPYDVAGQKQYLVHRRQCYIGVADDGTVTIRPAPGADVDTLVKPAGQSMFTALANFGTVRSPRPDGSFPLEIGDQIYMGDPEAVQYFQSGDPTAKDNYLVLELINKS
jgi:hypothetical protein